MPKREFNFNRMKKGKAKLFIETPPEPVIAPKPRKLQNKTRERRSAAIWSFLEKRPLLSRKPLSGACGWDQSNFLKYEKGKKKISEKYLFKLEKVLELYGLVVFR